MVFERTRTEKIAAVRIEGHSVSTSQRPDKLRNGVPGEGKPPVHVVAGIKQNKNAGPRRRRSNEIGPRWAVNDVLAQSRHLAARPGVAHTSRGAVLFAESGDLFPYPVLVNLEIGRTQTGHVPAFLVRYRHI